MNYNEGIVIDMKDGGHIMYINPGSDLEFRDDENNMVSHIYDDTKQIFTIQTNDISDIHWIPRQHKKYKIYGGDYENEFM